MYSLRSLQLLKDDGGNWLFILMEGKNRRFNNSFLEDIALIIINISFISDSLQVSGQFYNYLPYVYHMVEIPIFRLTQTKSFGKHLFKSHFF